MGAIAETRRILYFHKIFASPFLCDSGAPPRIDGKALRVITSAFSSFRFSIFLSCIPRAFPLMAPVTLLTATLSTLLPVAVYSKKTPVESIRAL